MDEDRILFNKFLKDKNSYNLNVGYWHRKLQKELEEEFTLRDLLYKNRDNKGKSLYDGNPMFSYYSSKRNKAIRIIQEDPELLIGHNQIKFVEGWISKISIPISDNRIEEIEVDEFVISIFLTHSSVTKCLELVREWFKGGLNRDNVKFKIG
jgi:hypothetical protein